jgi:hypothetical protein
MGGARPVLGFKRFDNAAIAIPGIGLAKKVKIKEGS